MHPQTNTDKCCVSIFHITTERQSFCKFSKANQTRECKHKVIKNSHCAVWDRESTAHYPNKENKYLFTRSASLGCLLISLYTLLININVRPISACGKVNVLMIQKIMNRSRLWEQHFTPCLLHLDTGVVAAGNKWDKKWQMGRVSLH